jgi:protein-S-isoprenylcysteine O-methyltransferase Ste14
MWLVTGAITQATAYSAAYTLQTDVGWLGVALMLPAMIWSGVFATGATFGGEMFRRAKAASTNYILLKTLTQIAVVWTLILVFIPYLITILEDKIGITRLQFPFQKPLAIIFFLGMSSVGVLSAVVMSRIGKGTPLPLDHATELVVVGPYKYVRNPMALSGIGQGLAVALFLGSPLVALYALMGSAIWQFIFRPLEEDDLELRFGSPFLDYRTAVKCWLPRSNPYSPSN